MEAQPLTYTNQVYSKKILFTIKIWLTHHSSPRSAYMLRKTGICPYIWWFWANIGRSAWFRPYIGKYGHGSFWYDLFSSIMVIYYTLSIYKDCSSYTAWSSTCFRTCRDCLLYIENYIFVYWTSIVSKRQYHYNITFSKRYDDIRSLYRYISGCSYIMPFPTLIMHVSNKRTFIIYILHFMFPYGISFFLI